MDRVTVSRELLRQAIEALNEADNVLTSSMFAEAATALRAALDAEPVPVQEPAVDSGCSQAVADAYERIDRFLRKNLSDDDYAEYSFDLDLVSSLRTPPTEPSCKWPTCQTEQYQQDLADQIAKELIGESRKAVKLSDSEVVAVRNREFYENTSQGVSKFARAIESAVWAKLGVVE